jgi:integrase
MSSMPLLDPLTRQVLMIMKPLDLTKITDGVSPTWAGFLRDWDRSLRAGNYPATTRYNYLLAAAQLGRYLAEHSTDPDADAAAGDPCDVSRGHVESFQAWMIESRSASTALNKHKGLQQFFKWLLLEDEIDRSPMDRVRQPKTPQKLIPIMNDDDTRKLLELCKGKDFPQLRDEAPDDKRVVVSYTTAGMPPERAGEFRDALLAVVERFRAASTPDAPSFELLVAIHPCGPAARG